jgi:SET domain-containing protein
MPTVNEFSLILKPSTIPDAGIGVFAAEDIIKGAEVFTVVDSPAVLRPKSEVPAEFEKFCIEQDDDMYLAPKRFDRMEVTWFLNHSYKPNIVRNGDVYHAIRDIKKGEEVIMDYNDIGEPEHLKEDYYKN